MNISGSGRIPAGEYSEKISVSGSGKIDGKVRCKALSCSGSVSGNGEVQCLEDVHGAGCQIDLVQYSEEIEVHPDAFVGKLEKI